MTQNPGASAPAGRFCMPICKSMKSPKILGASLFISLNSTPYLAQRLATTGAKS
jgi:hypothetical protein